MKKHLLLAVVDLGSNSFRLESGFFVGNDFHSTAYVKQNLRLGASLEPERGLSAEAMQQGWDCLRGFGVRLRSLGVDRACAVATQTLREASNGQIFIDRGSELLGVPIQLISGEQEADFIYLGVVAQLPAGSQRRLVMDLGGRSTELALGQGLQAHTLASYPLGSVVWTARFFADGRLTAPAFERAYQAACAVLQPAAARFIPNTWDCAYASAGTASAVRDVLEAHHRPADVITRQDVLWLQEQLLRCEHIHNLVLPGLRADRAPVVAGGLSVLLAVFDTLGLEAMLPAQGALRLGVLHGLQQQA